MNINKKKYRLGVLASGNGSNLQSIIDATQNELLSEAIVSIVISDKKKAYALERAGNNGIKSMYINPKDFSSRETYDIEIAKLLKEDGIDLIILAGYLRIITSPLLQAFPGRILNIHPSLLPEYGGVNMYGIKVHQTVLANNEQKSGCSVHVVTEEVDKGPIIGQTEVTVLPYDTPERLAHRILSQEHLLLPQAIKKYLPTLVRSTC
jgi:formyltetrahydrofolate-dependent phosphoribosylglycinamide formyltransferase